MRLSMRWVCGLLALAGATAVRADETIESLLRRLPPAANSIVIINATGIFNSPLAKLEDWTSRNERRAASGAQSIPPNVAIAVLGAQLDDQTSKPRSEWGVVALKAPADMQKLAIRERGKLENVANVESVQSARNGYFGKLADNVVGFTFPGVRRDYAKWVRTANTSDRVNLSKYLMDAARVASEAPIVIAIDAEDAIDEARAKHALMGCSPDTISPNRIDDCAKVLATVRGLTFAVSIENSIFGKVRIDFDTDAKPLAGNAKEIFLDLLSNHGVLVDDFKNWNAKVEGQTVALSGIMTPAGLRQLLAIVSEVPSGAFENNAPSEGAQALENPKLAPSKRYYKTTQSMLDDLHKFSAQTTGQYASMHESYATKIDRLPIYNVDDQLLAWGAGVADHLRAVAMSLRGANLQKGIIDASKPTTGAYIGFGGLGVGTGGTAESGAYWSSRRQAIGAGTQARLDQWAEIQRESAEIRRIMVAKYMTEF